MDSIKVIVRARCTRPPLFCECSIVLKTGHELWPCGLGFMCLLPCTCSLPIHLNVGNVAIVFGWGACFWGLTSYFAESCLQLSHGVGGTSALLQARIDVFCESSSHTFSLEVPSGFRVGLHIGDATKS